MKTIFYLVLLCFAAAPVFSQNSAQPKKQDLIKSKVNSAKNDFQQKKDTLMTVFYTCPLHPNLMQDHAGKCPECKANLVKKEVVKDMYTCPMHSDVKQDKPGKCPKCKMTLENKNLPQKGASKTI